MFLQAESTVSLYDYQAFWACVCDHSGLNNYVKDMEVLTIGPRWLAVRLVNLAVRLITLWNVVAPCYRSRSLKVQ